MFPMTQQVITLTLLAFSIIFIVLRRLFRSRSHPPYPPCPKGLPILGNLLNFPSSEEWITFGKWCAELSSDIVYAHAAGNDIIILNSFDAIDDLLEKRSSIYSSRGRFPMTLELMDCYWSFDLLPYGRMWRDKRRLFAKYLRPSRPDIHQPSQLKFARSMLVGLLDAPKDFITIVRHAIAGSAMALAYGIPIKPRDDPFVHLAQETVQEIVDSASPASFLVNLLPALKYVPEFIPGTEFKKKANNFKKNLGARFLSEPFCATVKAIENGTAAPSLVSCALEDLVASGKTKEEILEGKEIIMHVAATTFGGAADTSVAAVNAFFAAMLVCPETQKKAQEELDSVLLGRLPDFGDENKLPYISAIAKEVLRWAVITPLGFPHCSTEDDIYKDFYIPKGSTIIPNSWSLLRDEERYGPDTSAFKPERFLKDGKLNPDIFDPSKIVFGYGRRVCPGIHVAHSLLFIIVSTFLSTFTISEGLDEHGKAIEPKIEWVSSIVRQPAPFKCTIQPRSKEAETLIRSIY